MEMRTRSYGTDLSDEQWALVEPILPKANPEGDLEALRSER
jgi:transposase